MHLENFAICIVINLTLVLRKDDLFSFFLFFCGDASAGRERLCRGKFSLLWIFSSNCLPVPPPVIVFFFSTCLPVLSAGLTLVRRSFRFSRAFASLASLTLLSLNRVVRLWVGTGGAAKFLGVVFTRFLGDGSSESSQVMVNFPRIRIPIVPSVFL